MLTKINKSNAGFTLIELIIVIAVIAILLGISVPAFLAWRPNYNLKRAARDLSSNIQLVKMEAIKTNQPNTINFIQAPNGSYSFTLAGVPRTVNLWDYGDGIQFGPGSAAAQPPEHVGDAFPGDGISFMGPPPDQVTFNNRGLVTNNNTGFVYLQNDRGTCIGIGIRTAVGNVTMVANYGTGWADN